MVKLNEKDKAQLIIAMIQKLIKQYPVKVIALLNKHGFKTDPQPSYDNLVKAVSVAFKKSKPFAVDMVMLLHATKLGANGELSAAGDGTTTPEKPPVDWVGILGGSLEFISSIGNMFGGKPSPNSTTSGTGPQQMQTPQPVPKSAVAPSSSHTGLYIGIAVGVILVVTTIVIVVKHHKK